MEESVKRTLLAVLPIIAYGAFLCLMYRWWMVYYGTGDAGGFGFLFYLPYVLGGAAVMCFFLGRAVMRINGGIRFRSCLLYLALLLFMVYFSQWLGEMLKETHWTNYSTLFSEGLKKWWYPLTRSSGDTRVILMESGIAFLLGSIWQMRKERKREKITD